MKRMVRAYIAGPLRNDDPKIQAQNIAEAQRVAILYWNAGYNVYCPHLNSGGLVGLIDEETAVRATMEELESCDVVVFCKGWSDSPGSISEYWRARKLKKLIREHEIDPILSTKDCVKYMEIIK
jgi:hypothetical protein